VVPPQSRSRIDWLNEGDANTALFHLHARHRKRKNFISKLLSNDGHILTSQDEKEKNIFDFYSNLLGESLDREVTINLDELAIPSFDLSELDAPFSEDEVWRTISSLPSNKAPGPDGFTGKFYKVCWPIIKADLMAAISAVWSRKMGRLEMLNSALYHTPAKERRSHNHQRFQANKFGTLFCQTYHKNSCQQIGKQARRYGLPQPKCFHKRSFHTR